MNETILEIKEIYKAFEKGVPVLDGISLKARKGEFITFLGSSGCGKTTTLRIIAGLEQPDAGAVYLNGRDVTKEDPNKRNVNTVFQSYALFPHMNVEENVGYSLKLRGVPKKDIRSRVSEMLQLVQLSGYEKKKVTALSGGQRQRIAIARALIGEPEILLLDEPLGALDANLRKDMQTELKKLQKKLGITFIYITHDQEEAMNMSDRIVVMKDGKFEQIDTPEEIYLHPRTSFVAKFVGNANVLQATAVRAEAEKLLVNYSGTELWITKKDHPVEIGKKVNFAVRSENILIQDTEADGISMQVKEIHYNAGQLQITLEDNSGVKITASCYGIRSAWKEGQNVRVSWKPEHAVLTDWEDKVEKE